LARQIPARAPWSIETVTLRLEIFSDYI